MRYVSTRGRAPALGFCDALLAGLARDGGLYVPESWPRFSKDDIRALAGLPYHEVATRVMEPFVAGEGGLDHDTLARICRESYVRFEHAAVAPLLQLAPNLWLLELFHGPTLAFKDYAMQLLGRLFDHVLAERKSRITIVGATSGDTGSAAIEACRDRSAIEIFILHPKGRVSEVQRRQMTTVLSPNVHNIAIEGTFDDCQDLLKGLFNDGTFRDEVNLSGVNSINWARVLGQIVYYFYAAVALGAPEREIAFAVPTGNFGNIYAGFGAKQMGLPVHHLALVTNRNDILSRFLESGTLALGSVEPSLSPSMDIQVASNFERYLFEIYGRDGAALAADMEAFRRDRSLTVTKSRFEEARHFFDGARVDDDETVATIGRMYEETGEVLDPHSAVAVAGAERCRRNEAVPMVAIATAHPAKFPDAVERAVGFRPELPPSLADLLKRPERAATVANDLMALKAFVATRLAERARANDIGAEGGVSVGVGNRR
ncbi:MAG TPA: threonine synthase [Alphaproteobacteria bacterium]|nr:threonine synthase [Alphaproteobacteria bacterium]